MKAIKIMSFLDLKEPPSSLFKLVENFQNYRNSKNEYCLFSYLYRKGNLPKSTIFSKNIYTLNQQNSADTSI